MTKQSYFFAISAISLASLLTPVEVSACTKATTLVSGFFFNASSSLSRETGSPHSSFTTIASPPILSTFSTILPPKRPFTQTITLSPGSTKLTKLASIPALPGAEIAIVNSFFV